MAEKGFTLKWNGDDIISKFKQAQVAGVAEVAALSVADAARDTPVKTGLAQGSVRAEVPRVEGENVYTLWGSFDVNYYIVIELRKNPLRNSADKNYPKLAAAIKKHAQ